MSFFRHPLTLAAVIFAVPIYLIIWLFVTLFVRPFVGDKAMNHLQGRDGEVFGKDAPRNLFYDILCVIGIIAIAIIVLALISGLCRT